MYKRILSNDSNLFFGAFSNQLTVLYGDGTDFPIYESYGAGATLSAGVYYVLSSVMNGANDSSMMYGNQVGTRAASMSPFSDGYGLGASSMYTNHWDGNIAEVIVYDRALSASERAGVENYLALRYALGRSTSASPSVPAGATGVYVFGSTGAAMDLTGNADPDGGMLSVSRTDSGPGGTFTGAGAVAADGSTVIPDRVASSCYWTITNSGLSAFSGNLSFSVAGIVGVNNPDRLVILKRATSGDPWTPLPTTRQAGILTAPNVSSFSQFGIGGASGENPLPVHLSSSSVE